VTTTFDGHFLERHLPDAVGIAITKIRIGKLEKRICIKRFSMRQRNGDNMLTFELVRKCTSRVAPIERTFNADAELGVPLSG
jgi:hypothetical protein